MGEGKKTLEPESPPKFVQSSASFSGESFSCEKSGREEISEGSDERLQGRSLFAEVWGAQGKDSSLKNPKGEARDTKGGRA
jgi:hypothetical protein